jgi:hypothetical protein
MRCSSLTLLTAWTASSGLTPAKTSTSAPTKRSAELAGRERNLTSAPEAPHLDARHPKAPGRTRRLHVRGARLRDLPGAGFASVDEARSSSSSTPISSGSSRVAAKDDFSDSVKGGGASAPPSFSQRVIGSLGKDRFYVAVEADDSVAGENARCPTHLVTVAICSTVCHIVCSLDREHRASHARQRCSASPNAAARFLRIAVEAAKFRVLRAWRGRTSAAPAW